MLCLQTYFAQIREHVPDSLSLKKARHQRTQASMFLAAQAKYGEHMEFVLSNLFFSALE